jgi:hypothetical protein
MRSRRVLAKDKKYLALIVQAISVCGDYRPKFGQGRGAGLDLEEFRRLYRQDPFYSWFGLDSPLMYAAHKAAGGMTSIYRQIGIGCQRVFQAALQDELGLSASDATWSYSVPGAGRAAARTLSLDGRIPLAGVTDAAARKRVRAWMDEAAAQLRVDARIARSLHGAVFEVRQGYKSKDSKRQNADVANASNAYANGYLPVNVVLSTQMDDDIASRYRRAQWLLLRGTLCGTPLDSTYVFSRAVLGYDLAGFFERNRRPLKSRIETVLRGLLS